MLKPPKKRKPRGIKLTGERSLDLCDGCLSFHCDPMTMSAKFTRKITKRLENLQCPACGHRPCTCKSGHRDQVDVRPYYHNKYLKTHGHLPD